MVTAWAIRRDLMLIVIKHLLNMYCVLGTVLHGRVTEMIKEKTLLYCLKGKPSA